MKILALIALLAGLSSAQAFTNSKKVSVTCDKGALFVECSFENSSDRTVSCNAAVTAKTVWGHTLVKSKTLKLESLESQTILVTADHADPFVSVSTKVKCK